MRKRKLWLALILLGAALTAALAYFAWPRGIPGPPPLPSPNGYDDLVAAGTMVVGEPPDVRTASVDQLRQFVDANQAVIDRILLGLSRECGVPIEHSQGHIGAAMERMNHVRAAGRVLAAEAKLAVQEERIADAAKSYLNLVRLGNELARGGLVLDRQMGNAFERDGIAGLQGLRTRLDGELGRDVLGALVEINQRAEPVQAAIDREHDFQDALIADMGIAGVLNGRKLRQMARSAEPPFKSKATAVRQAARLLIIELALERHVQQTGSPPESLEDLVPRYLAVVPHDPQDDRPFVYQRDATGFYRLGPSADAEQAEPSETP
jgi:hypothetical protein